MNHVDPEIKKIFLRLLDRLLNPNFNSKYIWALFLLGSSLIVSPIGAAFTVNAEFKYKWITVVINNVNNNALPLFIVGVVFVILSWLLHYRTQNKISYSRGRRKLSNKITKLLLNLESDMNSPLYKENQKRSMFENKKKEIHALLIKYEIDISEKYNAYVTVNRSNNKGYDLMNEVNDYLEAMNNIVMDIQQ